MARVYDRDTGEKIDPREVLDDEERASYERSRRNHPARYKATRTPIVGPDPFLLGEGES